MKVLFFEPYTLAIPHYETALELIQQHINAGDSIYFYHCNANLFFCEANPKHRIGTCIDCVSRRMEGLKLIDGKERIHRRNFKKLTISELKFIRDWNVKFENVDQIKRFEIDGIDIGMAVASSFISQLRDPEPDTRIHHELIKRIFQSALKVYFSFKMHLVVSRPEIVYLFNGRFANLRVVLRLCEKYGITYRIHERGANKNKYSFYENHLPHHIEPFMHRVHRQWSGDSDIDRKELIASEFYHKRRMGAEQNWFSFIKTQQPDKLPQSWNREKRNIVIFNSSEDEFAAIGSDFHSRPFANQLDAIEFIAAELRGNEDVFIYLRIHPNLKGITNDSIKKLFDIRYTNFEIINSDSPISTYKLLDECDLVVTFGSTMGIEATFWSKPSVLIGNTFYKELNVTHNPESKEELINLILNTREIKPKHGALLYGYYLATVGIEFKYYQASELFEGEFKGVRIKPNTYFSRFLKNRYVKQLLIYYNNKFG